MVTSPNSPDAQTFAENDALPMLDALESELSSLSSHPSDSRFHELDGLLGRLIGQAKQAQVTVLAAIATRLRAVLQQFHQHQQAIPIDSLIQQLLLQAHECLQLPATELSMFGEFDAAQAQAKAEPILQQLEARLAQVNPAFATAAHSASDVSDMSGLDIGLDGLDDFSDSDQRSTTAATGSVGDLIDDLFGPDDTDDDAAAADADDWLMADDVLPDGNHAPISDLELATLAEPGLDIDKLFKSGFAAEEDDESTDWLSEADQPETLEPPMQSSDAGNQDISDWLLLDIENTEADESSDLFADTAMGPSTDYSPVMNSFEDVLAADLPLKAVATSTASDQAVAPSVSAPAADQDLVTPTNLFDAFPEPESESENSPESTSDDLMPDVQPLSSIAEADLSNERFEGDVPTERNVVTPGNLFEEDWLGDSDAAPSAAVDSASAEIDDEVLIGELFADEQTKNESAMSLAPAIAPASAHDLPYRIAAPIDHDHIDHNQTDPDQADITDNADDDAIFSDFIVPEPQVEPAAAQDAVDDTGGAAGANHLDIGDDLFGGIGLAAATDESQSGADNRAALKAKRNSASAELPDADNEALMAALFADDAAEAKDGTVIAEPTSTILSPRSAARPATRPQSTPLPTPSELMVTDAAEGLVASFWHSPESITDQGLIHLNRDRVEGLNQQVVQLTANQSWLQHQHQTLQHTITELQLRTDSATDEAHPTPSQAMLTEATTQLQQMESTLKRQQHTISNLRDQWIDAQTLPIYQFLQRFPTWLSQSVLTQQKPVQISIQAISARMDRATLETLQDAIAQLLQYSIEYSIEPQDIRQRRGKPEIAQIALQVQVQGQQAIFELTDDGWGLDLDAIRQDAAELGWGDEQTLADLSLSELIQQGGGKLRSLTTATRQVSTLSLVQTRLQDQQGKLSATTNPGQGLTFTIHLPLPLIKLDGLLCQVNEQFLAFSAAAIEEIVVPTAEQLTASGQRLVWNGTQIPVIALTDYLEDICDSRLAQQLDLPPVSLPETWHSPLLIVQTATQAVAIAVDAFVAQEALVIQALSPEPAANLPDYIQGCAALRNGQQVVMLDAVLLAEQLSQTAIALPM